MQISYIPEGYFTKLPNLLGLKLSNNPLNDIGELTFLGAYNLRNIGLDATNLSSIHARALIQLPRLEALDISETHLPALPNFVPDTRKKFPSAIHIQNRRIECFRE